MSADIIYLGATASSDSDFPLLRELQKKGAKIAAYYPLSDWNKRKGLIAAGEVMKKDAIIPAAEVPAFAEYAGYIDLDGIYVINAYHYKSYDPRAWWVMFKALRHMRRQGAKVFHTVWPLSKLSNIFYRLRAKRVVTVHDPFPHSGQEHAYNEKCRKKSFDTADKLVLLSTPQLADFCRDYNVPCEKVLLTKMGEFNYLADIKGKSLGFNTPYILFFGQIQPHKGVDDLLEAMKIVHEKYPEVKVVIAGGGKFSFDIKPYTDTGYVEVINRYITVPELAGLLQGCLFAVCPYKDATQSGVVQTAFSANVPLIVTNVGALPEAVADGVTGLVVPPSDPKALAHAIEKLIADPELIARFRDNIDKQWRPSMDWGPIADQYIQMYKELMQ